MKLNIRHVEAEVPPAPVPGLAPPLEIWRDHSGGVYAYGEIVGEECRMHLPGLASFSFTRDGDEIAAATNSGVQEDLVIDAYRRRILPMALQVRGREVLHASAVYSERGVIALCGSSLTGKSTIAFGLNQRGYRLWGDDALAIEISDDEVLALSLPFEIRLRQPATDFFGHEPANPSGSTVAAAETAPLAALCMLRRVDEGGDVVIVRRLAFADAFSSTLGHACWFSIKDGEGKRRVINNYMDLAARTPVFEVAFKSGLENLPVVLNAIEDVIAKVS